MSDHMTCPKAGGLKPCCCTGQSADDLRELTVEGTTFDPTTGGVTGLTSLDRNLEVVTQLCASADKMTAQDINQMHCLHAVLHVVPPGITFVWVSISASPVSISNAVCESHVPQRPYRVVLRAC